MLCAAGPLSLLSLWTGDNPCPWCGQHAAYLLQVENHSLQDGVEGLPAALPSGCCQGGESSSDISVRIEREGKATPHPPPASPATTHVTHPRDGQHARAVPAHLSPCSTWLADGAAGRGAPAASRGQRCAPASLLVLSSTTASVLGHGDKAVLPAR